MVCDLWSSISGLDKMAVVDLASAGKGKKSEAGKNKRGSLVDELDAAAEVKLPSAEVLTMQVATASPAEPEDAISPEPDLGNDDAPCLMDELAAADDDSMLSDTDIAALLSEDDGDDAALLEKADATEEQVLTSPQLDESEQDDASEELDDALLMVNTSELDALADLPDGDDSEPGEDAPDLMDDVPMVESSLDDVLPEKPSAPVATVSDTPMGLLASVQNHSEAIVALMAEYQNTERKNAEVAIEAERKQAQRLIDRLQADLDDARADAEGARSELRAVQTDGDDVLVQLSQALDQVRKFTALVTGLRQDVDGLKVDLSVARTEAESAKAHLTAERQRAEQLEDDAVQIKRRLADAEADAGAFRAEVESLRRVLTTAGDRPAMPQVAGGNSGASIYPVQVTAVVDCHKSRGLTDGDGTGLVLDVRLVAAIPSDGGRGVDNAVSLVRSMFPTAPVSVVVGEDCDLTSARGGDDVTFIQAPSDDSRRKAARVLSGAAAHLRRPGGESF